MDENLHVVRTRFLPATNRMGSRVRAVLCGATLGCFRIVTDYPHDCSTATAHGRAAWCLISRRSGAWQLIGSSIDDKGYLFVFQSESVDTFGWAAYTKLP